MGGVPEEHRADSLAAAYRSNAPWSRRLLLRGQREFADIDAYRLFVAEVFWRLKGRVARKFNEERAALTGKGLRKRKIEDVEPLQTLDIDGCVGFFTRFELLLVI